MKKSRILLSVIIPHYNDVSSLKKMLNSIPKREEVEIIVVDDKSDREKEEWDRLKNEFFEENINFYENNTGKKNAGTCRNLGISKAKGEWLFFADSDDYFLTNMFETFTRELDDSTDVIYFVPKSDKKNSKEINRLECYIRDFKNYFSNPCEKTMIKLVGKPSNPPWIMAVKRSLVEAYDIRFSEIMYSNDIMFTTKVAINANSIKVSNQSVYCLVERPGSLTKVRTEETFKIRCLEYIKTCSYLKKKLSRKQYGYLHSCGIQQIIKVLRGGYGLKNCIYVIRLCKEHDVPIFVMDLFNPVFIFNRFIKKH